MQNYKISFSDSAITSLSNIVRYITEKESHTCAKHVERELLHTAKSLKNFPNGYAKDEYTSTPGRTVRFVVKWSYKILYIVDEDSVYILDIFHMAQAPALLYQLR